LSTALAEVAAAPTMTPEQTALQEKIGAVEPQVVQALQHWLENVAAQARAQGYGFFRLEIDERGAVARLSKLDMANPNAPGVISRYASTALEATMRAHAALVASLPKAVAAPVPAISDPGDAGRNVIQDPAAVKAWLDAREAKA
jgi:hypothetical protein